MTTKMQQNAGRHASRSTSRRAVLAAALGLALLLTTLASAGCGRKSVRRSDIEGDQTTEADASGIVPAEGYKPVAGSYGGRIILSTISDPKSFNPVTASETTTSMYTGMMYLGLTTVDKWSYEVKPELAESWQVDETGTVWTLRLRPEVLWSDGEPFTADDVVFTYDTIYDERWVSSMRDIITGPEGERWRVEKIDEHTVRFTLFEVNAIFLQLLATEIIPAHAYRPLVESGEFNNALGVDTPPEQFVCTGPFIVDRYELGRQVVLRRNPHYYRKGPDGGALPYLDEVVFVITPDLDVSLTKFRNGELDALGLRGEDYPTLVDLQESDNFKIIRTGPAGGSSFVFFNMNSGTNPETRKPFVKPVLLKWFSDVRFRRAVSHLVDRDFLVASVLNGLGYPQYGPLNAAGGYYFCNPEIPTFPYDPAKADELLTEMGLIDRNGDGVREDAEGNELSFNLVTNSGNTVREKIAATIIDELGKAGFRVNYRPMNFNELVTRLDFTFDWECCVMSLTGGPEPLWGANVWRSSGQVHMWHPRQESPATPWEAEIDRIFASAASELDREKRREMFFRWQQLVGENQPLVYTVTPEGLTALRNRFGNIFPAIYGGFLSSRVLHNLDEIFVLAAPSP